MNYWQIIGGVGIFLFGIRLLENALKNLMSRPFKLFLKKQTSNPLKAIAGGTLVTAILQSSSAVNFMVLAFVSTGVMALKNAFAVIMGANLGTTVTSWIVATVGFSMNIEQLAYPVAGIAGIVIFIAGDKRLVEEICKFLLGFSFLFIGLSLMQSATENEAIQSVFSRFAGDGPLVFLLLGFAATTITQSSAATVAITLSILNRQLIGFESSLAVVIGSEVGTAIKLLLGALDGVALKKRVSAGNLFYNLVTTIGAFVFLHPLAVLITDTLSITNPLYGLVTFQSLMNFFSIVIFLPFLDPFSQLLEKLFPDTEKHVALFLKRTENTVPGAAIEMLKKETGSFIVLAMEFNGYVFHTGEVAAKTRKNNGSSTAHAPIHSFNGGYEMVKELYGEINAFYLQLRREQLYETEIATADQLMDAVRSAMYAAKCIKDVHHDVLDLENSSHAIKYDFLKRVQQQMLDGYSMMPENTNTASLKMIFDMLSERLQQVQELYTSNIDFIYAHRHDEPLGDLDFATLMNFNRAVYTSHKSMVMSWKNYFLDRALAEQFGEIPTYRS